MIASRLGATGVSRQQSGYLQLSQGQRLILPTALHFKLALEDLEAAESYEELQFTYRPQLDEDRDSDLIEVLPDYLTEEITFPRHQASKFYARVIKSLMERVDKD